MWLGENPLAFEMVVTVGVFSAAEASDIYVPEVLVACAFYAPDFDGLPLRHVVVEVEGEVGHVTEVSLRCAAGGFQTVGDIGECCKEYFGREIIFS